MEGQRRVCWGQTFEFFSPWAKEFDFAAIGARLYCFFVPQLFSTFLKVGLQTKFVSLLLNEAELQTILFFRTFFASVAKDGK